MKSTHALTETFLNALMLLICCLTGASAITNRAYAQSQSQGPTVGIPSGTGGASGKIDADLLSKAGPQFGSYLLSRVYADVLAKAGPMVIEYQLDNESTATLTITVKGKKEPFIQRLRPTGAEIKQELFQLPETFGKKPQVAKLSVNAENLDPANTRPPGFELVSVAHGSQAVGSLKIDQLSFNPAHVPSREKINVTYSFHSLADFDRAAVEFRILGPTRKGEPANGVVNTQKISGGVRRGETKNGTWDGKNQNGKISKGRYLLFVRTWFQAKNGGDWSWVSDPARQRVIIE